MRRPRRAAEQRAGARTFDRPASDRGRCALSERATRATHEFSMPTSTSSSFFTLKSLPRTPPIATRLPSCPAVPLSDCVSLEPGGPPERSPELLAVLLVLRLLARQSPREAV